MQQFKTKIKASFANGYNADEASIVQIMLSCQPDRDLRLVCYTSVE